MNKYLNLGKVKAVLEKFSQGRVLSSHSLLTSFDYQSPLSVQLNLEQQKMLMAVVYEVPAKESATCVVIESS